MLRKDHYRPDIDGLRGVSILCILLYHTDIGIFKHYLSGAFVTLDIFFVISGFLITKGIIKSGDSFSFKNFYIRRVKRLFPTLFLTIFLSTIIGFYIYPLGRVLNMLKTGALSMLPFSNIYFAFNTNYFSYGAKSEPFLHTWSLALEEQFYLIYPIILLLILRKKINKKILSFLFVLISIITISIAEKLLQDHSSAVYYLLPFRLYQLLAGALINFIIIPKSLNKYIKEIFVVVGIALNVYSVNQLNFLDPFPGINSIFPTLGTFLIILFGSQTKISNFLFTSKPLRFIGASCYGIYLFHWPIFLFYKYLSLNNINYLHYSIIIIITVLLGCLSWEYLEKKVLKIKSESKKEANFLKFSVFSLLTYYIVILIININDGFPNRYPKSIRVSKEDIVDQRNKYWNELKVKASPDVLFIGNSHAVDLIYMFKENNSNFSFNRIKTTEKCHHFIIPVRKWNKDFCLKIEQKIFTYDYTDVKKIYLHDYWWKFNGKQLKTFLINLRNKTSKPIVLFGPKMAYVNSVIDIVQIASLFNEKVNLLARSNEMKERILINKRAKEEFNTQSYKNRNIYFVDLLSLQCGEDYKNCKISDSNKELYYFDDNHFNLNGAKSLGHKLRNNYPALFDVKTSI